MPEVLLERDQALEQGHRGPRRIEDRHTFVLQKRHARLDVEQRVELRSVLEVHAPELERVAVETHALVIGEELAQLALHLREEQLEIVVPRDEMDGRAIATSREQVAQRREECGVRLGDARHLPHGDLRRHQRWPRALIARLQQIERVAVEHDIDVQRRVGLGETANALG